MANNESSNQFDLFSPHQGDLRLRDQRETMERPFFSLSKRKRMKPINYVGPNGKDYVQVQPSIEHGMATIFDADILIWLGSMISAQKDRGTNDITRFVRFHPSELLRGIGRATGGLNYKQLEDSLERLAHTSIKTNISHSDGKTNEFSSFHWINGWTKITSATSTKFVGLEVELSQWIFDGIMKDGGLLAIDDEYFTLTGGRAKWLYRVARKHAGGAGGAGFTISLPTMFKKSGADGTYREFKHELKKLCDNRGLLDFHFSWHEDTNGSEPSINMVRRSKLDILHPNYEAAGLSDKRFLKQPSRRVRPRK